MSESLCVCARVPLSGVPASGDVSVMIFVVVIVACGRASENEVVAADQALVIVPSGKELTCSWPTLLLPSPPSPFGLHLALSFCLLVASEQDLADSDCVAVEMLRSLRRLAALPSSSWDAAMKASIADLTFMTEGSSGQPFELVEGGSEIFVTPMNLDLFIRLSERCRLLEGRKAMEALVKGIAAVLPLGRLRMLFDWR